METTGGWGQACMRVCVRACVREFSASRGASEPGCRSRCRPLSCSQHWGDWEAQENVLRSLSHPKEKHTKNPPEDILDRGRQQAVGSRWKTVEENILSFPPTYFTIKATSNRKDTDRDIYFPLWGLTALSFVILFCF